MPSEKNGSKGTNGKGGSTPAVKNTPVVPKAVEVKAGVTYSTTYRVLNDMKIEVYAKSTSKDGLVFVNYSTFDYTGISRSALLVKAAQTDIIGYARRQYYTVTKMKDIPLRKYFKVIDKVVKVAATPLDKAEKQVKNLSKLEREELRKLLDELDD